MKHGSGIGLSRATILLSVAILISQPLGAAKFSDWSVPINLGAIVNSASEDFAPHISKNGLSLFFASTRATGFGGEDLWVCQRESEESPWGTPVNLGPSINTLSNERSPALSRDGHFLFFATDRPGFGGFDLWVSWRAKTHDDFGWEPPVSLGAAINSAATDAGPAFLANDDAGTSQLYLASNRSGGAGSLDIWVSTMTPAGFGPPVPVVELNTAAMDLTPSLRHDGLEIFFASSRPGSVGSQDLWTSNRESLSASWSAPVNLGALVNSVATDGFPSLSSDGETLFFQSNRPNGVGGTDLYVTSRTKSK